MKVLPCSAALIAGLLSSQACATGLATCDSGAFHR